MRKLLAAALCLVAGPALAASTTIPLSFVSGSGPSNSIVISDASGSGETSYPLQFGRPFLKGAIPHAPAILVNGVPVPSQADVKNRYPDGSVEYAVMAVVVPTIPANGSVTLTFADTTTNSNTPLTAAQMEAPAYNFDAAFTFTPNAGGTLTSFSGDATNARTMLANGDYKLWTSGPVAQTVILGDNTATRRYDVGFGDGFHPVRPSYYATFWPATNQVSVRAAVESGLTTEYEDTDYKVTITAGQTAPVTVYTGNLSGVSATPPITGLSLTAAYAASYTGYITFTGNPSGALPAGHFDALIGSEWVELSYVAPQIYLWTRALRGTTAAPLTSGEAISAESSLPKQHWAGTGWTQRFWLGGAPPAQVNIDNNLAYLESTRFLPNYDAATVIDPAALTTMYALWTGKPHDIYDGVWNGGLWTNYMGTPGARYDISPYPTWTALWLYTGDWRMRQMALGMGDLAAAWPYDLRETDPTKILNRGDAAGTGLGLPFSIIGRPTLLTYEGDLNYETAPADMVKIVGPVSAGNPWVFEGSHEPAAFYPQYILTGDPWYLNEMEMWASLDAARYLVAPNVPYGRGPDGSYAGINDEVRGAGWVLRDRTEVAFAVPDGNPEKVYLQTLTNDALARWEGVFGIAGTTYDGTAMKTWGASTGDYWSWNLGPNAGKVPTLHYWESNGNPTVDNSQVDLDVSSGWFLPNAVGSITDLWMHWYSLYSLGRAAELGFASGPFQQYTGQLLTGLINSSGTPKIIGAYEVPSEIKGGGFPATYTAWLALFTSSANSATNQFLTCSGTMPGGQLCLADYFASNLYAQGRPAYAMAALAPLVDEGAAGAATAWSWIDTNARQPIAAATLAGPSWKEDPSWDVIPRTDANVLPAQPTNLQ